MNNLSPWRRLARHLGPELARERRPIALAAVALMAEVALRVAEPWPVKVLIDHALGSAPWPTWLPAGLDPATLALLCGGALLTIVGLRAASGYVETVALALAANRVLTRLRGTLFHRLQLLPLTYHQKARAGDLTVRLTSDVGMLQDVTLTAALPLLADAGILVGMVALMAWRQPALTAVALLPLPFFLLRWRGTHRRIRDAARVQRKREGAMAATASESLSAIRTVQALSLGDAIGATFSRENQRTASQGVRAKRLAAGLERSVDVAIALSTALLLWYGTQLVLRQRMTAGDLLVFAAYLKTAFKPLQSFAKYTSRLGKAAAAAERVLDVLDRTPGAVDAPGAVAATHLRGEVHLDDLHFAYHSDAPVLSGVSARVRPGELVAIVGASGAGKSTLVHLLLRLYPPSRGQIRVDGQPVDALTLASWRSQVGVVLQDTVLFAGTVRENLTLGTPGRTDDQLLAALRLANADGFVAAMPQGLDTMLGERGATLSNGQRQRLSIARAVLRDTPILVLDEPTVGLDEENEQAVCEALLRLARGRTTFLVTHALHLAARADRVLVLQSGRLAEDGTPAELLRRGGAFASWYRDQSARHSGAVVPLPVSHAG